MKYTVPTIQHTGTKLLARMFGDIHWASFNENTDDRESVLYLGHLTVNSIEAIKRLSHPIIVPLRHPYLVAESWQRRGKPLTELVDNFRLLVNEIDKLDPHYLPVDIKDRDRYLDLINRDLGLNLSTEWKVVNSVKRTYNIDRKDLSPNEIVKDLVKEIEPFLSRFY